MKVSSLPIGWMNEIEEDSEAEAEVFTNTRIMRDLGLGLAVFLNLVILRRAAGVQERSGSGPPWSEGLIWTAVL